MLIKNLEQPSFSLDNFEGPLDFLLYLIQKNEIDIYNISLQKITEQFKEYLNMQQELSVDSGAEFVGLTASLMWIKSKMLLPKHDQEEGLEEEGFDPEFAIIHHLLDYCRFKEVAKQLSDREQKQIGFYSRGQDVPVDPAKRLGVEHLSIQDLAGVFQEIMQKAAASKGEIHGDTWQVSDKIALIRQLLVIAENVPLGELFKAGQCRDEIIVTFLAILELMKLGEIKVVKEIETNNILILRATG
jgi:segregation and condensation protein A